MSDIRVIQPTDRVVAEADSTSGMVREQAIASDGVWVGEVKTTAQRPSGWHHHGEYDTYIYVRDGQIRFEFGPDGKQIVDANPGDFVHVPQGVIHREVNPSPDEGSVILVRVGSGPPVINVDGPSPN